MGKLKLEITFRGGKADDHLMSTTTLAKVFHAITSDIENVYRVISSADVDVTMNDIKRDSKLYLAAQPKASSFALYFVSEDTPTEWIQKSGIEYARGLKLLGSGGVDALPYGIGKSILEHAKQFASPFDGEYETMELKVPLDSQSDIEVLFDEEYGTIVERELVELNTTRPLEIHGHEIEGVLHALDDQDYTKPFGPVLLKVAAKDGDWVCEIDKGALPMNELNEVWGKRVFMRGFAIFRPRKKTLRVDPGSFEVLPDRPNLLDAMSKFIEVNAKTWEGQNPQEYLDSIREQDK